MAAASTTELHIDKTKTDTLTYTRPSEWKDEDRMHFLLAPFPPNTTPSSQDPKLSFWSTLVLTSSKELKKPSFTREGLRCRFKWNQTMPPSCLGQVIRSMERSGVIVKKSEFNQASSVGWLAWGVKVVSKPVGWALSGYLPGGQYTGEYVITALVKEYAEQVLTELKQTVQYKTTDSVMKVGEFDHICQKVASSDNVALVQTCLIQSNKVLKQPTELGYDVVKICDGKTTTVSEIDIGIIRLKEAVKNLTSQVESLSLRIQSVFCPLEVTELLFTHRLRQSVKDNLKDRKRALRLLRQSKALEITLERREGGLENLQNALHQIQMAETDVMIYQAYKSGASTLKSLKEVHGLSVESAEEAVSGFREALEDNEEITGILNAGDGPDAECDDDDLERELATLLEPQTSPVAAPPKENSKSAIERELEDQLASLSLQDETRQVPERVGVKKKQTPLLA